MRQKGNKLISLIIGAVFLLNLGLSSALVTTNDLGININSSSSIGSFSVVNSTINHLFVNGTSGNVGIGTTAPTNKLEVMSAVGGAIAIHPSTDTTEAIQTMIKLHGATISAPNRYNYIGAYNNAGGSADEALVFGVTQDGSAPTERMRIAEDGNVGIGTTSPAREFHVNGSASTEARVSSGGTTNNAAFEMANGGSLQWQIYNQGSTNDLFIDSVGTAGTRLFINQSSGNVGIGTTSPSNPAGFARSLEVFGSTTGTGGAIYVGNTATNGNAFFGFDTNDSYLYNRHATGKFYLGTNAGTDLTIDGTGNVGIGTTAPDALLHVEKASAEIARLTASTASAAGYMALEQGTTIRGYLGFQDTSGGSLVTSGIASAVALRGDAGLHLTAGSAATTGITVTTGGNVGIGTTAPTHKLDVSGAINASQIELNDNYKLYFGDANDLAIYMNGTHNVFNNEVGTANYVFLNGNVGIGTVSPGTNLQVGSGTFPSGYLPGIGIANGDSTYSLFTASDNTHEFIAGIDNTISYGKVGMFSAHDLAIITGNAAKIYINNSNGNVGIGTTAPSYKLDVNGVIYAASSIYTNAMLQGTTGLELGSSYVGVGAPSNGAIIQGNVGIGTTSPNSTLSVNGLITTIPLTLPLCQVNITGAIGYNSTSNKHMGCNSTDWVNFT